jgi:hypothetical protein
MTTQICNTFGELAQKTWTDLCHSNRFGLSLGEESITDFLLLELKLRHPSEVSIIKFNRRQEGLTTGADWEWWFGSPGSWFGMRVQAKKLESTSLIYDGLDHTVRSTRQKQFNLLINDAKARNLYPIYTFYNYWDVQRASSAKISFTSACGCPATFGQLGVGLFRGYEHWGCTVADAYAIRKAIRRGTSSLKDIAAISIPWEWLVCCPNTSPKRVSLSERARFIAENLSRQRAVPGLVENPPAHVSRILEADLKPESVRELFESDAKIDGVLIIRAGKE